MTAHCGWCTFPSTGRIRPFRVHRPNWKAECVERCLLRLEGGKGCKVLPILTQGSLLITTLHDTEPLMIWGRYLHQVADAVIEASYSAGYLHAILVILASRTCRRGFGSTHEGTDIWQRSPIQSSSSEALTTSH